MTTTKHDQLVALLDTLAAGIAETHTMLRDLDERLARIEFGVYGLAKEAGLPRWKPSDYEPGTVLPDAGPLILQSGARKPEQP